MHHFVLVNLKLRGWFIDFSVDHINHIVSQCYPIAILLQTHGFVEITPCDNPPMARNPNVAIGDSIQRAGCSENAGVDGDSFGEH